MSTEFPVDLSAFQRDLLWAIFHESARTEFELNIEIETYYDAIISTGHVHEELNKLIERDLVVNETRDEHINRYSLTETAHQALEAHRAWIRGETA